MTHRSKRLGFECHCASAFQALLIPKPVAQTPGLGSKHTHTHTCTHIHTHTYTHTHIHCPTNGREPRDRRVQAPPSATWRGPPLLVAFAAQPAYVVCACVRACVRACVCACVRACARSRVCAHARACVRACKYIHEFVYQCIHASPAQAEREERGERERESDRETIFSPSDVEMICDDILTSSYFASSGRAKKSSVCARRYLI